MRPPLVFLLPFVASVFGCGDEPGSPDSAGDAAGDAGLGPDVAPPAIGWLDAGVPPIEMTPCPEGFRAIDGDVIECAAYGASGPEACAFGEAHFPGESGCRPIGAPCPSGRFADDLPSGVVVFVDATAAAGGDGTRTAPFDSLARVSWTSLAAGTTVALAPGEYGGVVSLKAGVSLVGACVAGTVLTGEAAPVASVVTVTSAGEPATLRNVTIRDVGQVGVLVRNGRALTMEGVRIEGATDHGIEVAGAGSVIAGSDVVIEDTHAVSFIENAGVGVREGGTVELTRFVISDNDEIGVYARDTDSTIRLQRGVVRLSRFRPRDRGAGGGVGIERGAVVELSAVAIEENREVGLSVSGEGSRVSLTDVAVVATRPRASDGGGGLGVLVEEGALLEGRRVVVADNDELAILARGAGTRVTLQDASARGPADGGAGRQGRGISIEVGAELDATRLLVTRHRGTGLIVTGAGAVARLVDATLREAGSKGVSVELGARLEGSRVLVTDTLVAGVVGAEDAVMVLHDTVVRRTGASAIDGAYGRGVSLQARSVFEGVRLEIDDNREIGFFAALSSTADLTDVSIRNTASDGDGLAGYGLVSQQESSVTGERMVVEGSHGVGVVSIVGAAIDLHDALVRDVRKMTCGPCAEMGFGHAAVALGADLRMNEFVVREAATCGVLLASGEDGRAPELDLASGIVEETLIGACVQVDGYDLGRLMQDVSFRDNGSNLDATALPTPTVASSIE